MDEPRTHAAARYLIQLGVSVIPMRMDRTKRPGIDWKEYQERLATPDEVDRWFGGGAPLGVVTGPISGNLVMAELEGRAAHELPALAELAESSGLGELWSRLETGWKEISPSGGVHWFFRTESVPAGNRKLARRPSTPEELEEWKAEETAKAEQLDDDGKRGQRLMKIAATTPDQVVQTLAETRGTGGFVVVFPTPGHFHKSGQPWQIVFGCSPDRMPTLTDLEVEQFLGLLSSLDRMPDPVVEEGPRAPRGGPAMSSDGGVRPGDDFELRMTWKEILEPHGWTIDRVQGGTTFWVRPGKDRRDGASATTGHAQDRDRLYVFSSSTPFETERPYTMFSAYAVLNHGGDMSAAAAELRRLGYGRDPESFGSTPPRMESIPGSRTRQDRESELDPGRDRTDGTQAVIVGSLAPVTNIETKRRHQGDSSAAVSRTDEGNARLFIDEHSSSVRYDTVRKVWFVWEKTRWIPEEYSTTGNTLYLAREVVRNLPRDTEEARKWQIKCMTPGAYERIVKIAATEPALGHPTEAFDAIPWELNTPAGPVDLRTGTLLPPDPSKLHTKSTEVVPDFDADRSAWLDFLTDTFPENTEEMIDYVQRLIGYSVIGDTSAQILIFGMGSGGNGKGVLMETVAELLGNGANGYALGQPPGFLTTKAANDHPEAIANMKGARFVTVPEIDHNAKLDEGRAKALSGADRITARYMREGSFSWKPTHQLWMTGNVLPRLDSGGGDSLFRRLKVIPFLNKVPKERVDRGLRQRLVEEYGPAILAWIIEGAAQYAEHGLGADPVVVAGATIQYREEQDTFALFLEEKCLIYTEEERLVKYGETPSTPVLALYEQYKQFCDANNMSRPISQIMMSKRLRTEYGVFPNKWNHELGKADKTIRGASRYMWIELSDKSVRFGNQDDEEN